MKYFYLENEALKIVNACSEVPPCQLIRETYHGNFIHFYKDTVRGLEAVFIFPGEDRSWVVYTFC